MESAPVVQWIEQRSSEPLMWVRFLPGAFKIFMPFFYTEEKINSPINGQLTWRKFLFGRWLLKIPEGEYYSSTYLEEMWKFVLKKIRKNKLGKVLVLGGGAGCVVNEVIKVWPQSSIVAIDYDGSIMEIGQKIYPYFKTNPQIIFKTAEAQDFVRTETAQYDLVLIDLFVGNKLSPLLKSKDFLQDLKKILLSPAIIIVNAEAWLSGKDPEIFDNWQREFPQLQVVKFRSNKLFLVKITKKIN